MLPHSDIFIFKPTVVVLSEVEDTFGFDFELSDVGDEDK